MFSGFIKDHPFADIPDMVPCSLKKTAHIHQRQTAFDLMGILHHISQEFSYDLFMNIIQQCVLFGNPYRRFRILLHIGADRPGEHAAAELSHTGGYRSVV